MYFSSNMYNFKMFAPFQMLRKGHEPFSIPLHKLLNHIKIEQLKIKQNK